MRVLIVGCGYLGAHLGALLSGAGHDVTGIRRSRVGEADLIAARIQPLYVDIIDLDKLARLPANYDWVVNCVSSSRGTAADYRANYLQGIRNLIEWLKASPPRKFVYTSSTSVYGQTDGSMVTEKSLTQPSSEIGEILLATENALLDAQRSFHFPGVILRLAGIYGPGRGYWFREFLNGTAVIDGAGSRILNMVHRDDVALAVMAALERAQPGEIYNVVDDEPVTQIEFFTWLSRKLGRELPSVATDEPRKSRKRGITNKRVSNEKLKTSLGYHFKYPTFREGYSNIINEESSKSKLESAE